jgi:hypothetical protein
MEELARRFCREARTRSGLRYSQGLRQVALEYADWAERSGRSEQQIATMALVGALRARSRLLPQAQR